MAVRKNPGKIPTRRRFRFNLPLLLGLVLVGGIVYLGITGPGLAPRDPLEENLIIQDPESGEWHIPPFEAFDVTGFPLGSDEFGRDIFSRLLFAIRPTMQMVLLVAAVRLVLGTLIGLVAGWSTGRLGSFFDSLISSALALPGLLVALGAIAIVGVELGVIAFVIGLSITGWAETARLVREQTRTIRREVYIEAAHALGSTDPQIVFRHVLRQIRPMLLMLLAFEVGSTLMLTAGLGFLGYYIGGDVWVDVDDFVARRTSGDPELGQMLATVWVRLTDPWPMVAVGSVVFGAVLGFNLIGEGLRLRIDPEAGMWRLRGLSEWLGRVRLNLEQAWYPVGRLLFGSRIAISLWLFALGLGAGYSLVLGWQSGRLTLPEPETNLFFEEATPVVTPTPVGTSGDQDSDTGSAGSQTISAEPVADDSGEAGSETEGTIITATNSGWIFTAPARLQVDPLLRQDGSSYLLTEEDVVYVLDPAGELQQILTLPEPIFVLQQTGFGGGPFQTPFPPIIAPDGSIVVASDTRLYAVGLDGEIAWEIPLDDVPHSPPLIGPDGETYYQLDRQASLYAFTPQDGLVWKHEVEDGLKPAYFFPVFSSTGEIYYSITNGTRGQIEALNPDGTPRWRTAVTTFSFYRPIQITPDGAWISLDDNVIRASDGELIELAETEFRIDQFIMGADGRTYLLSGATVMEWNLVAGGRLSIQQQVTASVPSNVSTGTPPVMGVSEDGMVWFRYFGTGGARVIYVWVEFDGTTRKILTVNFQDEFILEENLADSTLTICSLERSEVQLICRKYGKAAAEPIWEIVIQGIPRADSLHYLDGTLFVQTASDTVQTVRVELP